MADSDFLMAENPEENARLFASMDHGRLVENNIAAANLIVGRLAQLEKLVGDYRQCLVKAREILNSSANLGRTNRKLRDEAVTEVTRIIGQLLELSDGVHE